jgi:excinuclease ABC subunit C
MSDPDSETRITAIREKTKGLPKNPGVYLFKDSLGRVLYVGKAVDLRSRVASYFQDSAGLAESRGPHIVQMTEQVVDIDWIECDTEVDALLQENRLIKDIQPPYNERLRDDKTFPYLEITVQDDFPAVYVTRTPNPDSKLYGPFVSAAGLRAAVNGLQKAFKFRTCGLDIAEDDPNRQFFRPCILFNIGRCTAPCGARISKEEYRKNIQRLIKFMGSSRRVVLKQMMEDMEQASQEMRFEDAARLRDQVKALESLSLVGDIDLDVQPEVFRIDPAKGLERLGEILGLASAPRIIEGIDIANLQGQESVGSLVCFIDGKPFKNGYRRFKIKDVPGQDDYAMIREVIQRRYREAAKGEELYPDVILIDGGLGQLHAALGAFGEMDVKPASVISLAKREEEIYTRAAAAPLRLPRNDDALRLLQAVRDEAHRFAQHYHHILRRKRVLGEEDMKAGRRRRKKK